MNLMKIKAVANVAKKAAKVATKASIAAREYGPNVAIIAGVVGLIGGAVYAAYQTTKLDEAVEEAKETIEEGKKEAVAMTQPKSTIHKITTRVKGLVRVARVYAGPAAVILISAGSVLYGLNLINGKLTAVTGALIASQAEEKRAWEALESEVGKERTDDIRYGMHTEKIETETVNENGKIEKKEVSNKVLNNPKEPLYGKYSYLLDESTVKYSFWDGDPWKQKMRYLAAEQDMNNLKDSREGKYVFLNEALKAVGYKKLPKIGWFTGWYGDKRISFGLDRPWAKPLMDEVQPEVVLSMNCDGYILDKIKGDLDW